MGKLRWMKGYYDKDSFDADKPGKFACYLSHLAIMRETHALCPHCDLVVFEDDIVFIPNFHARWRRFFSSLPADWDYIKIGSPALWSPSFDATEQYLHVRAPSSNFGYVVRARV